MVIDCWQFAIMMSLVVVLLMVPIVSWAIRRRLRENKAKTTAVPPLMYITTVTDARTIDVDIPVSSFGFSQCYYNLVLFSLCSV